MDPSVRPAKDLLRRVRNEFIDMPGLCVTEPQARRLWGLNPRDCSAVLGALVDAAFLLRTRDGLFMRVDRAPQIPAV